MFSLYRMNVVDIWVRSTGTKPASILHPAKENYKKSGIHFEDIILSEISQSQNHKNHLSPLLQYLRILPQLEIVINNNAYIIDFELGWKFC